MARSLLAFDLGAESGRAMLGRFDGDRLSLSEVHRFANRPVRLPDGLHWNVLSLWQEITHGLRASAAERLDGIGLAAWGVDFALLDTDDRLVGNPFHYRDDRTDGMMAEAFRRVPRAAIFRQTGIQFMQINSLYQLLSMRISQSPALSAARTFLTIPDLFNFWLTGVKYCEFSNATTTQCYDPLARDWARALLADLSIPADIFPQVIDPGTLLGPLSARLAEELGVARIPVIAPACHDTGSAAAAVPATASRFAWISSGTWSIVGVNVTEAVVDDRALAFNLTNEGGVAGDFRLSKNVMGLWLVQECRRSWAASGRDYGYDKLTAMSEAADPLASLIDPDADDFLKPGDMPARIRDFCARTGQIVPESEGAVVRCALESVALKYRWVLERLEAIVGYPLEIVHIVGGGARNRLLSQLTADATGRQVIAGPVEATTAGNLLAQALALGYIDSWDEAREVVRVSFPVDTFVPRPGAAWDEAYGRLASLLSAPAT